MAKKEVHSQKDTNDSRFDNFRSRLNRIFIELPDYSFFHGPSEINHGDSRYIGRSRLIDKFRSILTDSEKKSGTYLITGFRGMGKTSFVNKVLHSISGNYGITEIIRTSLRILLICAVLNISSLLSGISYGFVTLLGLGFSGLYLYNINKTFHKNRLIWEVTLFILMLVGSILIGFAVFQFDGWYKYLISYGLFSIICWKILISFNKNCNNYSFLQLLLFQRHKGSHKYLKNFALDGFQITIILLISYPVMWINSNPKVLQFSHIMVSVSILFIFNLLQVSIEHRSDIDERISPEHKLIKKGRFRMFLHTTRSVLEKIFNNYDQIFINLNLGYTDLKEIDILRLIARNIKTKYLRYQKSLNAIKVFRICVLILVFILTGLIYKYSTIYEYNNSLKENLNISYYLPSQSPAILNADNELLTDIIDILKEERKLSVNNLQYILSLINSSSLNHTSQKSAVVDSLIIKLFYFGKQTTNPTLSDLLIERAIHRIDSIETKKGYIDDSEFKVPLTNLITRLNKIKVSKHNELTSHELIHLDYGLKLYKKLHSYEIGSLSNFNSALKYLKDVPYHIDSWDTIITNYSGILWDLAQVQPVNVYSFEPDQLAFVNFLLQCDYPDKETSRAVLKRYINLALLDKSIFDFMIGNNHIKGVEQSTDIFIEKKKFFEGICSLSQADRLNTDSIIALLQDKTQIPAQEILDFTGEVLSFMSNLSTELYNLDYFVNNNAVGSHSQFYRNYKNIKSKNIVQRKIASVSSQIDILIYFIYERLYKQLLHHLHFDVGTLFSGQIRQYKIINSASFRFIPRHLDYLLLIYFFLFAHLVKILYRITSPGKNNVALINKKIAHLNDIIDSHITIEKHFNLSNGKPALNFNQSKKKEYAIADEREIEKYLIEIIDEISNLPRTSYRASFTIVFDELDKIEPKDEFRADGTEHVVDKTGIFTPEGTRKRQHTILNLLSNLKYFLSTARAKFIFIAGREMFDASLADVSDRNFNIGSIFHNVINLDSFLAEVGIRDASDYPGIIEQYVCKLIMPKNYKTNIEQTSNYSLISYQKYLETEFPEEFKTTPDDKSYRQIEVYQKTAKIIYILRHFISYLSHYSKGAPNKITTFFDKFVTKPSLTNNLKARSLSVGIDQNSHYLFFKFEDQYHFSIIHYLHNPINQYLSKVGHHSDKLLVSSSFLIDHLFKFHKSGFSWRNIESSPEIVDINKSSELREFVKDVIAFLTKNHLDPIVNGLFDFKFSNRISRELNLLSKINDEASASYNFMLDESLAITEFYKNDLKKILKQYQSIPSENMSNGNPHVFSISSVQLTLGDLYYYDEEYSAAIPYYSDSIQNLRSTSVDDLNVTQLAILTRNMLKLGLALEKRKTYDTAYLTYNELSNKIANFFNKNVLQVEDNDGIKGVNSNTNLSAFEMIRLFVQPILSKLHLIDKRSLTGITQDDILRAEMEFAIIKKKIRGEKKLLEIDFYNKIGDILYYKSGNYFPSDEICDGAKNKGSKCHDCFKRLQDKGSKGYLHPCAACQIYLKSLRIFIQEYFLSEALTDNFDKQLTRAMKYVTGGSLEFKEIRPNSKIFGKIIYIMLRILREGHNYNLQETSLTILANLLSDIGDTRFGCANNKDLISLDFINLLLEEINKPIVNYYDLSKSFIKFRNEKDDTIGDRLEDALMLYYISSVFYKKVGNQKYSITQLNKILITLREVASMRGYLIGRRNEDKNLNEFIDISVEQESLFKKVQSSITHRAIRDTYKTYDNLPLVEPNLVQLKDLKITPPIINSILPEIEEITIAYDDMVFRAGNEKLSLKYAKELIEQNSISPYSLNSNMYCRTMKLKYKTAAYKALLKSVGIKVDPHFTELDTTKLQGQIQKFFQKTTNCQVFNDIWNDTGADFTNATTKQDVLEFIISDAIFCLFEALEKSKIYGINFGLNHSHFASLHRNLASWSHLKKAYTDFLKGELMKNIKDENISVETNINQKIESLIDHNRKKLIDIHFNLECALTYTYLVDETQNKGKSYRDFIDNQFYMDDDLNDEESHFAMANERYRLNTGFIKKEIQRLSKLVRKGEQYDVDSYNRIKTIKS